MRIGGLETRISVSRGLLLPAQMTSLIAIFTSQELMEPFHYINQVPGKDVRGKLIDAFQVTMPHRRDMVSTICIFVVVLAYIPVTSGYGGRIFLHLTMRRRTESVSRSSWRGSSTQKCGTPSLTRFSESTKTLAYFAGGGGMR